MAKKFASKAAQEQKERKILKKQQKREEQEKKKQAQLQKKAEIEILKKQQKREEQEKKKQEQLQKKAEAKSLLEKEMISTKANSKRPVPQKITRAQISWRVTGTQKEEKKMKPLIDIMTKKIMNQLYEPLVENMNRLTIDGEEARSVTDAILLLSSKEEVVDKHPEKRMKAAYTAYEERRLKQLKVENPSLRLSQLKQMIFKEWQKSPENQMNKARGKF